MVIYKISKAVLPRRKLNLVVIFAATFALGCISEQAEPNLSSIQENIFDVSCTHGCHDSVNQEGSLDLSPGKSFDELVNITSVTDGNFLLLEPGDPDNSYLVRVLESTGGAPTMPPFGPTLPQGQIDAIRTWISNMQP